MVLEVTTLPTGPQPLPNFDLYVGAGVESMP